jgi:hypothetical protein
MGPGGDLGENGGACYELRKWERFGKWPAELDL